MVLDAILMGSCPCVFNGTGTGKVEVVWIGRWWVWEACECLHGIRRLKYGCRELPRDINDFIEDCLRRS